MIARIMCRLRGHKWPSGTKFNELNLGVCLRCDCAEPRRKLKSMMLKDCQVCGQDTTKEFLMLQEPLWERVILGLPNPGPMYMAGGVIYGGQLLCIGCIEDALGRKLGPADFTDAPCHRLYEASDRLLDRLAS